MRSEKRKRMLPDFLLRFLFVVSVLVFAAPSVCDCAGSLYELEKMQNAEEPAGKNGAAERDLFAYNRRIAREQKRQAFRYRGGKATDPVYESLPVKGSRQLCYLLIPEIDLCLPVLHGTGGSVLEHAAGHMYGTSLPFGGTSTHAVLAAHSGLVRAKLFSDLDRLQKGDFFYIRVLGKTRRYRVSDVRKVWPEEADAWLQVRPGEDLVTLYTCTPKGINTHRLLVTGRFEKESGRAAASAWRERIRRMRRASLGKLCLILSAACGAVFFVLHGPDGRKTEKRTGKEDAMTKRKKRQKKIVFAGLALWLFVLAGALSVQAGENEPGVTESGRTGAITIRYLDGEGEGKPVGGASFVYYRVAGVTGDRDGVADVVKSVIPGVVIDENTDPASIRNLVAGFYADHYKAPEGGSLQAAQKGGLSLYRAVTGKDGMCRTEGLVPGIYLAVEEKAADGYLCSDPFLFSVPFGSSSADDRTGESSTTQNYEVTAEPKPQRAGGAEDRILHAQGKDWSETGGRPKTGDAAGKEWMLLFVSASAGALLFGIRKKRGERI